MTTSGDTDDTGRMTERQRDELLGRVHRTSGTLGGSIPETVRVDGESVPVREFYFEVSDREELTGEARERVEDVLTHLRRERAELVRRIRNREVDYATAESLVPDIRELDRAINAFESVEDPSYGEQVRREKIESARELVEMMREFGKL
ncbi:DUF5788 family protein [Halostella salina]|uniref:DUF5788 family protein n=1 Tax=Halostella salina TaxID=1547897 RepID=UPI000EF79863|nr:DUF5788 family protein [Halostella salina]